MFMLASSRVSLLTSLVIIRGSSTSPAGRRRLDVMRSTPVASRDAASRTVPAAMQTIAGS